MTMMKMMNKFLQVIFYASLAIIIIFLFSTPMFAADYSLGKEDYRGSRTIYDDRGRVVGKINKPDYMGRQEIQDDRGRRIGVIEKPDYKGNRRIQMNKR